MSSIVHHPVMLILEANY